MADDEMAFRHVMETWTRASQSGDTHTVLSLMTEDAVFMVPGREPFGREAFRHAATSMADVRIDGTNDIVEIQVFGDRAFTRKGPDGRWRLARDANLLTATKQAN